MNGVFQTGFVAGTTELRIGETAYPVIGEAEDGSVLVEAPVEVGQAQGWQRRLDLEAARRRAAREETPYAEDEPGRPKRKKGEKPEKS